MKEEVTESFLDDEGRLSYRLERSKRYNETDGYLLSDVWYVTPTNQRIEKVEEDVRYVKMVFPVKEFQSWDGNVMNTFIERTYEINDLGASYAINGLSFDSTLVVDQGSFQSFVDYEEAEEVYAKGVGLIKKVDIDLRINNFQRLDLVRGREIYQELIEYSIN